MPLEQQLTQLQQCAHTHNDHKTATIIQEAINNIHKLPTTHTTESDKRRAIEKTIQPRKDLQEAALRGGNKEFGTLIDKSSNQYSHPSKPHNKPAKSSTTSSKPSASTQPQKPRSDKS